MAKVILCDVDDTVLDLVGRWIEIYNKEYNDDLKKSDIDNWDIASFTKIGKDFFEILKRPHLYDSIEPMPYALESINNLRKDGHRVVFVTMGDYHHYKYNWLTEHNLLQTPNDFVVATDKSLIKGDVMIDDNLDNLENFSGYRIVFDQRWNWNYDFEYGFMRCSNWPQICATIYSLK